MEDGCSSSKTSAGAASGFPDDPLLEIFSRVPAKSVCRFKCVSMAWRDLIAHPDHRKKLRQPMQGLFVQTSEFSEVDDDELDDAEVDGDELVSFSFSFIDLKLGSVPLDIDSCFSFLTEMSGIEAFFLDSCNGLILFGQRQQDPSHLLDGYIVCNPTTRQWAAVPASGSSQSISHHTHLAFDPAVSCHFHLVLFHTALLQMADGVKKIAMLLRVYSSETGTWSQNQVYYEQKEQGQLEGWHHQFTLDAVRQCVFVNGFLHFIVYVSDVRHILAVDMQGEEVILAVDIQGKVTRMITVPGMADGSQEHVITYYLGQSQGRLHCVTLESTNEKISTWVLQDDDTQEWVLKTTVNSLDVFGMRKKITVFEVVDIHQDCNVVLFFHQWNRELIAYNMDSKEVSVIASFEHPKSRSEFARYIPYFSESPALMNKY